MEERGVLRVLRNVLGPWEQVRENWKKRHNEELNDLCSLSNTVGRTRWARHVAGSVREKLNANEILVRTPEERPRVMWEGIITVSGFTLNDPETQPRVSEKPILSLISFSCVV
jgi:hypothetical protein